MKRLTVVVSAFLLTVLLCSCGIPASRQECFSVPESFICDVFFAENDKDYVGLLEKDEDKYTLTVTSPDSLNGLKVMYENGEYSAAFSGGKMPFSPKKDFFMQEIIEFIESSSADSETLCEEKDGKYIIHQNRWELRFSKN